MSILSSFIRIQWRPTFHRFGKSLIEGKIAAVLDVVHGSPPQPWRDVESEEEYRKDIQIPDSARHEPDISPYVTCT